MFPASGSGKQLKPDQARAFRLCLRRGRNPQSPWPCSESEGYESEGLPISPFCRFLVRGPAPQPLLAAFSAITFTSRTNPQCFRPLALAHVPGSRTRWICAQSPGGKSIFLGQLARPIQLMLCQRAARRASARCAPTSSAHPCRK